jgi:hypothetical protein
MGWETRGDNQRVVKIIPTFKKIGAAAGAAKCLREFNMPIKRATILIKNI